MSAPIGVVLMAYGTPDSLDQVEAYYTHIRGGRPPTGDQLADLRRRYEAIGGTSPLAARTEAQRLAIQQALDRHDRDRYSVALGLRHSAPFIEDAVALHAEQGTTRLVGLVLAPHYSKLSIGGYLERAAAAAAEHVCELTSIEQWHLTPALTEFLATGLTARRAEMPPSTKVLFTAHSLPVRALVDDPYPRQLRESAAAIAARVDLLPWPDWALAWQSAARTSEPWQGPDVRDVIDDLARTGRSDGVLVCPQGFVSDHLEIAYDLDIDARVRAESLGLAFARTPTVNDDLAVMSALADLVIDRADAAGWT
jgi:ferrochelatase